MSQDGVTGGVAIYARVSQDASGEGLSVSRQQESCSLYAQAQGLVVTHEFTDTMSASKENKKRPGWMSLLKAVEAGEISIIIAYAMDRITRSMRDLEDLIDLTKNHDVKILCVSGHFNLASDQDRTMARIMTAIARGEVERKGERQRHANNYRTKTLRLRLLNGPRPVGFTDKTCMEINEAEARHIRQAADDLVHGRATVTQIARRWDDAGLRSGASEHRGNERWSQTGVKSVLLNPLTCGHVTYRDEIVARDIYPAILTDETQDAVRRFLDNPARKVPGRGGGPTPRNLLTKLALCSCGAHFRAGNLYGDPCYRCVGCRGTVPRFDAEGYVGALVVAALEQADTLRSLTQEGVDDELDKALLRLEQRETEASEMYATGAMSYELYQKTSRALSDERHRLTQIPRRAVLSASDIETLRAGALPWWRSLPLPRKRALIMALFASVTLEPRRTSASPWEPRESVSVVVA